AAGSRALAEPELSAALDVTSEQKEKIAAILRDYGEKQGELRRTLFGRRGGDGPPPDFEAMRTKTQELDKERDSKAAAVLSEQQREKYVQLKGKSFDVSQLMPPGPGRRAGPGARGGPGGRPGRGAGGAAGRPQKKAESKNEKNEDEGKTDKSEN
ncbi:MAG TPA: hypothetical protein VKU82_08470, partial [Planctomycetaceae bacterium]|nr:hypothetical protein [Planctomycetaceae bacterium]